MSAINSLSFVPSSSSSFDAYIQQQAQEFVSALQEENWGLANGLLEGLGDNERVLFVQALSKRRELSTPNECGRIALHFAVFSRQAKIVSLLLEVNPNFASAQDFHGRTPLFWAASHGFMEIVHILLAANPASASIQDNLDGDSALSRAMVHGCTKTTRLLLAANPASAVFPMARGRTSFHKGILNCHENFLKHFLDADPSLEVLQKAHRIALDCGKHDAAKQIQCFIEVPKCLKLFACGLATAKNRPRCSS